MMLCNVTSLFIVELFHWASISVPLWQVSKLLDVLPSGFILFHSTNLFLHRMAGNMVYSREQITVPAFLIPTD